jgi:hypothetical protein
MTDKNLPSIEYLHKRLRYDPETGKLFWKDCDEMPNFFRAQRSGKEAMTAMDRGGYLIGKINRKTFKAHRVAWAIQTGRWPQNHIDHINGVRCDNRFVNLQESSPLENQRNRSANVNNTSGACGVVFEEGRWRARIGVCGKVLSIGSFATFDEAKSARDDAAKQYGFTDRHKSTE